jgi:hypothetical protein
MRRSNLAEKFEPILPTEDRQKKYSHFAQRCGERGIVATDPWWLAAELEKAVLGQPNGLRFATKVIPCFGRRADVWRLGIAEGIFYAAVGHDGHPRTVLTKDMVRKKKLALKRQRRGLFGPLDKNRK